MVPALGWRNLVRRLKQVVFPAPFGPMIAVIEPAAIERSTSFTARKALKSRVSPFVSRMMSATGRLPAVERASAGPAQLHVPSRLDAEMGHDVPREAGQPVLANVMGKARQR